MHGRSVPHFPIRCGSLKNPPSWGWDTHDRRPYGESSGVWRTWDHVHHTEGSTPVISLVRSSSVIVKPDCDNVLMSVVSLPCHGCSVISSVSILWQGWGVMDGVSVQWYRVYILFIFIYLELSSAVYMYVYVIILLHQNRIQKFAVFCEELLRNVIYAKMCWELRISFWFWITLLWCVLLVFVFQACYFQIQNEKLPIHWIVRQVKKILTKTYMSNRMDRIIGMWRKTDLRRGASACVIVHL